MELSQARAEAGPGRDDHPLFGRTIVHVVRQYRPGVGGIEAVVEALAKAQRARGIDARVVTLDRIFDGDGTRLPAREIVDGVPVARVPFFGSRRYPIAPGVLAHIGGAALVHVHAVDFLCDYLAFTKPLHRRPMVLSTHGGFFHTGYASHLKRLWFGTVTRLAVRAYGFVAGSSVQDAEMFGRLRRSGVGAIENGVDTAKFAGAGATAPERTIIYFGRLAPNKGLRELIAWFAAVRARSPGWRLLIAGKPMGVTVPELEGQAERLGIGGAVEVHANPGDAELRALIGRASAYACASHFEGFGLAAVESMSAGLFPALSAIPAFERTLARTGVGIAFDFTASDAPARFLAAWSEWASLPDRRELLAAAVQPFGWPPVAAKFERLYGDVLGLAHRTVFGVRIAVLRQADAIALIDGAVAARRGLKVAFANAHTLNLARADPGYAAVLNDCLLLNDGIGVDLASRILYRARFPENLNGTDFTPAWLGSARAPLRVFLLGAKPDVIERAARIVAERWPRHTVVGYHSGYFAHERSAGIAADIHAAAPDLVLIGMGNPRQEIWAGRELAGFDGAVLSIGAWFDFLTGEFARAPATVQRLRAEWLFRLALEPRRLWRRYLVGNATFLLAVARQWLRGDRA